MVAQADETLETEPKIGYFALMWLDERKVPALLPGSFAWIVFWAIFCSVNSAQV